MKNETWLIRLIIGFTSVTTFTLLADGTFIGFIRASVGTVILDGLVEYWSKKRIQLKDTDQRRYSNYMTWTGVGMAFVLAVMFGVQEIVPVGGMESYPIFGYTVSLSLHDFILMLAQVMIGGWAVLTLGVVLYLQWIDPEVMRDIERSKALEEQEKEHTDAYKSAMKGIQRVVGTEKAFDAVRQQLKNDGKTEAEIENLLALARMQVAENRGEAIPVEMRQYKAEVKNFTKPSTR